MNFASRQKSRKATFLSPYKQEKNEELLALPPHLRLDSPYSPSTKKFNFQIFPFFTKKPKRFIKSLSQSNFNISIFSNEKLFEKHLIVKKNECDNELRWLLSEVTEYCSLKANSDKQARKFLKVFLNIYMEFVEMRIESFKEKDFRRLFTLIDSSKKSLLNPEISYQEYREYWIIRVENFYKNDLFSKHYPHHNSPDLKNFYMKFMFILYKLSRILEMRYIIDEGFKDMIKKPIYNFQKKNNDSKIGTNELISLNSMSPLHLPLNEENIDKKINDFFSLKLNHWVEGYEDQHEFDTKTQTYLTCKICLKEFPLELLKGHSYKCKEMAEVNKDLVDLKKEFIKAEYYSKEMSRKLFLENQLERNILRKLKNQSYEEEKSLERPNSAHLKVNKARSNTYVKPSSGTYNPPSPSIFKRRTNFTYVEGEPSAKLLSLSLKQHLNTKIRNFMDTNEEENKEPTKLDKIKLQNFQTPDKISQIRNKIIAKNRKIADNETFIEFMDLIKKTASEVAKNQYCPKIELRIDDTKTQLKNRPNIIPVSKISKEAAQFINDFTELLENYNINGHKYLTLMRSEKNSLNSPEKRLKRSGTRLSDDESKKSYFEKSPLPLKNKTSIFSSGEKFPTMSNSPINHYSEKIDSEKDSFHESGFVNSSFSREISNDIEESPLKFGSNGCIMSLFDSQNSSSLDKENKPSMNCLSFKTKMDKNNESSDDEKSVSINMSSEEKLSDDSENLNKEQKCFSDSASNLKSCQDLFAENRKSNEIGIHDFEFIKLINKGAFGRVWLVRRKKIGDLYAMKIVNCLDNMNKNKMDSLKAESEVFDRIYNEFVVKSYFRFTYETFICFVMEFMYGDFSQILKTYGCLEEKTAKFYIAELILAVEHLHSLNIIHRDLKPDNILIDVKGHIKLTDFGLSDICMKMYKNTKRKTYIGEENMDDLMKKLQIKNYEAPDSFLYSFTVPKREILKKTSKKDEFQNNKMVGTPDYMAPEMIANNFDEELAYGLAIDWWSIGVILFELLVGIPPFNDENIEQVFDNIMHHRVPWDQIEIGYGESQISPQAFDLINQLLNPNPKERLASAVEIKKHEFFKDLKWDDLRNQTPPIIPEIRSPDRNFLDKRFEEREFGEPFILKKDMADDFMLKETKKMLRNNIKMFTQTRFDLLNQENLKSLQKFKRKKKENFID